MEHHIVHVVVLIAATGVIAQWCAWRLKIPAIVILTATGALLGPITGILEPTADFGILLRPFVQIAVAIILFEGGLNLHFHELREAGAGVRRLVSFGFPLTFIFGSLAAHYLGSLSWPVALVFGAIITVTGPTVIMPLLRQARLQSRPATLLKWEGIVNDPLGALLAVLLFEFFLEAHKGSESVALAGSLIVTLVAAGGIGGAAGYLLGLAFRMGQVPEFLKGPGMLAGVLSAFVLANLVHDEAGLVATTVMGVVMGNMKLPSIDEMRRFKEYITVVLVSGLFIVLTADLDLKILTRLDWNSAVLLAAIIFLVRPAAVFLATLGAKMPWEERILTAWIAPRGIVAAAVAGAFSARMIDAGIPDAAKLLPLTFALILLTVTLHGLSLATLARRLGLASENQNGVVMVGASPWSVDLANLLVKLEIPVVMIDSSWHRLRPARLSGVPVYFGQVVSETADEQLDLSAMGTLLALSDNDAYNALVCTRFANEFGRNKVYQLPMLSSDQHESRGFMPALRGKMLFGEDALYEELLQRYFQGWRFQRTRFTESYTFERYQEEATDGRIAIALVRKSGAVEWSLPKEAPTAGDTLLTFGPPRDSDSRKEASDQKSAKRAEKAAQIAAAIASSDEDTSDSE